MRITLKYKTQVGLVSVILKCRMLTQVVLFILLSLITFTQLADIDDSCFLEATNTEGVCKLSGNCPVGSKNDSHSLQKLSVPCGVDGEHVLVCCAPTSRLKLGQISKTKCKEYQKHNSRKKRRRDVRVEPTASGEYPHMAAVGYGALEDITWSCGGSLISEWFILTAAHCFTHPSLGSATYVKIGILNLTDTGEHVQQIKVAKQISYPKYQSTSYYHDIGLIKLENPAQLYFDIRPACLYQKKVIPVQKAVATGWGSTEHLAGSSNQLLYCNITLVDFQTCKNFYKTEAKLKDGIIDEIQFCAGASEEGVDTCQGDSGGPFQIHLFGKKIQHMYDIIGVTSFGKVCYLTPGVYTRVSYYIEWIEDNVWPQDYFTAKTPECSCNVNA